MPRTTVEVEGGANLARTMRIAARVMADMPAENRDAASTISRAAGSRVPRKSGALAASIRPEIAKAEAIVYAGSYAVPYAGVIEYGWAQHSISAQPYLEPSLTSTETEWLRGYEKAVQAACNHVRGA